MVGSLVYRDGDALHVHRLDRDRTSVGRSSQSDVHLSDPKVSSTHFVVERRGEDYFLRDCDSRNLTLLNGRPVVAAQLLEGDIIQVGLTSLVFRASLDPEEAQRIEAESGGAPGAAPRTTPPAPPADPHPIAPPATMPQPPAALPAPVPTEPPPQPQTSPAAPAPGPQVIAAMPASAPPPAASPAPAPAAAPAANLPPSSSVEDWRGAAVSLLPDGAPVPVATAPVASAAAPAPPAIPASAAVPAAEPAPAPAPTRPPDAVKARIAAVLERVHHRRPTTARSILAARRIRTWTWLDLLRRGPIVLGSMAVHLLLLLLSVQIVFQINYRAVPQPIMVTLRPVAPEKPPLRLVGPGAREEAKGTDPLLEKGNNRLIDEDPETFPDLPPPERMKPDDKPSAVPVDPAAAPGIPPYRPDKIAVKTPEAPASSPNPNESGNGGGAGDRPLGLKIGDPTGGSVRGNLKRNRPGDDTLLDGVRAEEVIVTTGVYDNVEKVLDSLKVPYTLRSPRQFDGVDLAKAKVVLVNCPGYLSERGLERLRAWVAKGGHLFTTDWSILLLERGFYGYIQSVGKTNQDWVAVAAAETARDHPLLEDVFTRVDGIPQWWLESGSFPVKVLVPEKVQVLVTSEEMRIKYGHGTIAATFPFRDGRILHVCSHFDQASGDAKAHFSMAQLIVNYILAAKKAAAAAAAAGK